MGKHCDKNPEGTLCKAEKYCEANPDKLRCKAAAATGKVVDKAKEKGKEALEKAKEKSETVRLGLALQKLSAARKYFRKNRKELDAIDEEDAVNKPAEVDAKLTEAFKQLTAVRDAAGDIAKTKIRFSSHFFEKANKELAGFSDELSEMSAALAKALDKKIGTGANVDAHLKLQRNLRAMQAVAAGVKPALDAIIDPSLDEDHPSNNEWLNKYLRTRNKVECALDPVQCVLDQLPDMPDFVK